MTPPLRSATIGVARHRRAALAAAVDTLDHRCVEPLADDRQHRPIGNPPRNAAQQVPVRDRVEVVREIGVHHFARSTLGDAEVDAAQRHLGVQALAEAVLPGEQVFIEDRSQHQQHRHLHDPVADGRDAQRALPAICLGDPYRQQGRAPVRPGAQLLPQSLQPGRQSVFLDARESLAVDPGRAAVGAAASVGFVQDILAAHLIPQAVEPVGCFALGFHP